MINYGMIQYDKKIKINICEYDMYINKVPFRFSLLPSPFPLSYDFRPGYPSHVPFSPGVQKSPWFHVVYLYGLCDLSKHRIVPKCSRDVHLELLHNPIVEIPAMAPKW